MSYRLYQSGGEILNPKYKVRGALFFFITISTSDREEILRTYIVTPTTTAGPIRDCSSWGIAVITLLRLE